MSSETTKKLGRPRKILDADKIAQMIGKAFTVEFVADFMGVHVDTLYSNYSDALRKGYAFRNGCLQAKQFKDALKGNATLQIWLGKQWLAQSDKSEVKATVEHTIFDPSRLTEEQLAEAERLVESAGLGRDPG